MSFLSALKRQLYKRAPAELGDGSAGNGRGRNYPTQQNVAPWIPPKSIGCAKPDCPKKFRLYDSATQHWENDHKSVPAGQPVDPRKPKLMCPYDACQYSTNHIDELEDHLAAVHPDFFPKPPPAVPAPPPPSQSSYGLLLPAQTPRSVYEIMTANGAITNRFFCRFCPREFWVHEVDYLHHVERTHPDHFPYQCPHSICQLRHRNETGYARRAHVKNHARYTHGCMWQNGSQVLPNQGLPLDAAPGALREN